MGDRYLMGENHPRAVSKEQVKNVIDLVVAYPERSTHEIAQALPAVGNHGVQNVLMRLNLNTIQKR